MHVAHGDFGHLPARAYRCKLRIVCPAQRLHMGQRLGFRRQIRLFGLLRAPCGGALLGGLSRRIQTSMRIPCQVADNPVDCVVRGTGMALENMELYGDLVYDYRKPVRYDFQR